MNKIKAWFRLIKYNRAKRKALLLANINNDDFEISDFDHLPFISYMENEY